mmetsp:Transcript_19261/g.44769  ORF Transcript_19261/g.44769 Transcript_19261/m.44769 type:complete len:388 (-) Transcript_19261:312-1475(-)
MLPEVLQRGLRRGGARSSREQPGPTPIDGQHDVDGVHEAEGPSGADEAFNELLGGQLLSEEARGMGRSERLREPLVVSDLHGQRRGREPRGRWRRSQEGRLGRRRRRDRRVDGRDREDPSGFAVRDPGVHGGSGAEPPRRPGSVGEQRDRQRRSGRRRTVAPRGVRPERPRRQRHDGTGGHDIVREPLADPRPSVSAEGPVLRERLHPLRTVRRMGRRVRARRKRRREDDDEAREQHRGSSAVHHPGISGGGALQGEQPQRLVQGLRRRGRTSRRRVGPREPVEEAEEGRRGSRSEVAPVRGRERLDAAPRGRRRWAPRGRAVPGGKRGKRRRSDERGRDGAPDRDQRARGGPSRRPVPARRPRGRGPRRRRRRGGRRRRTGGGRLR